MEYYLHRSSVDVPPTDLFQWHAREGALERLNPPWRPFNLIDKSGGLRDGTVEIYAHYSLSKDEMVDQTFRYRIYRSKTLCRYPDQRPGIGTDSAAHSALLCYPKIVSYLASKSGELLN
jgi:hypothetical protein